MSLAVPVLVVTGLVSLAVLAGWAVFLHRRARSGYGGLVVLWFVLLLGSDLLRARLETDGPSTRTSALLVLTLLAFMGTQVLLMRRIFDEWVGPVLDVVLTGLGLVLAGWALVLVPAGVGNNAGALELLDLSVAAWLLAAVLKQASQYSTPSRTRTVATLAFPFLHLAGVALLLAPGWGIVERRPALAVLLLAAAYVPLIVTLRGARRAPVRISARSTRGTRLVPYVLVLTAMVVALLTALVRDDDAARSPRFLSLCLVVVIALSLRQILTVEANAALVARMAERERLYRSLVQDSTDVIMIADHDGRLEYVSPASDLVLGARGADMAGRPVGEVLSVPQPDVQAAIATAAREGVHQRLDSRLGSGAEQRSLESIVSVRGETVVLNVRDVTERSRLREQLHDMAFHDPLTGLFNRTRLLQALSSRISTWRAEGGDGPALLFLDLDGFKGVNDAAGHGAGDRVLRSVAERLAAIRPDDAVLARLGGDEFVVLLDATTLDDAVVEAERIADEVSQSYVVDEGAFVIGVSIGVAMAADAVDAEDLLRNADLAMYAAKRGHRSAQAFEPSMHRAAVRRADNDLVHAAALDQRRVELHYQPIVSLDTSTPVGVEALLRWRSEDGDLGAPGPLLEYAERSGRMAQLSSWVLATALDQVEDWREDVGLVPVAVNLAPVELLRHGLVRTLREELAVRALPPSVLTIEITEQVLMQDPDRAIRVIGDLRALGIRVSIDDFGTGFSSLAYLVDLPVDALKIDRSFVQALPRTPTARVVVSGIIDMARDLGLVVVAEGIETAEQRALLTRLGDPLGQGHLFGRAVPADDIVALLTRSRQALPLGHSSLG
jgi:diguanylate cyclase (GGDEF)-like protein/PAS domain S-box-containing protein